MRTLTRIVLLFLAAALLASIVAAQEEPVTGPEPSPSAESSIAENEEVTDAPQQTDSGSVAETTWPPSGDPVSFQGAQRSQTDGTAESSASSNSESANSDIESANVESAPGGPMMDAPAESLESQENQDPESEEAFTLPAGK